jgi:hypothetical protein
MDGIVVLAEISGGPLYKVEKSSGSKLINEMELPNGAFAVIPITKVFTEVTERLMKIVG